jgi:hypothetical protein
MTGSLLMCRPDESSEAGRRRKALWIDRFQPSLQEVRELPNGFALRFEDDGSLFGQMAEWMRRESACIPFLDFELRVDRRLGSIWLRLTGDEGVKELLRESFPTGVARRATREKT